MPSDAIAVFTPSEAASFTSTGRTNSPSFTQTMPECSFGSTGFDERADGTTLACEDGVQRSAALGTERVSDAVCTTKWTLAVRYGSKRFSGFSVLTSTVYITTFCVMVALRRTLPTAPLNSFPGNASQVNVTGAPGVMRPTSASFTATQICIFVRSLAIKNRLGALRLDTTVCPMFT